MSKIKLVLVLGLAAALFATLLPMVSAHRDYNDNYDYYPVSEGKGLRVHLTINSNFPSQQASIGTYQYGDHIDERFEYVNQGTTEITLKYQKHEIENGPFQICVRLNSEVQECGKGYDTEAREPVYVTVNLHGVGDPTPMQIDNGNSQAQSSSNNNQNENNNALSQSQETTIIICNDGKCKPAQ